MCGGEREALSAVRRELRGARLIWLGIRGEDAEPLLRLPEFSGSFSLIAALQSASMRAEDVVSLEQLMSRRLDPDADDIDAEAGERADEFRRRLIEAVRGRCVLITYRPTALASDLAFSMNTTMRLAGMFADRQASFEHKPWVETQLKRLGIVGLGWTYVGNEDRARVARLLEEGPQILRTSRRSGGVGIALVTTADEVDASWPVATDTFVGVSRYLAGGIPVNLSGCVFADGAVRLHPASVQLIGIASCIDRPFGYCGNDFAALGTLPRRVLDGLDEMGITIGNWLHRERYLGAFGVDALVVDETVHFVEVNARFQGSSALSAEIATGLEVPDLFLDHLAATLGLEAPAAGLSIAEWAAAASPVAHVVVHNALGIDANRRPGVVLPETPRDIRVSLLARGVDIAPGGTLGRLSFKRSVTATGFDLDPAIEATVTDLRDAYAPIRPPAST